MTRTTRQTMRMLTIVLAGTVTLVLPVPAIAAEVAPVKEIVASHFGSEVDKTTKANICTVVSGDECQPGQRASQPGTFYYPAVAGAPDGNIYVADRENHRVQELTSTGAFVLMFGREVNKKGGDLCTKTEESQCQAGVPGPAPGQFDDPLSVAVDPVNGDVYVAEALEIGASGQRVQKFTATGVFVLEIGREVNETKDHTPGATQAEKNLCTQEEVETKGVKCTHPVGFEGTNEPGAFDFEIGHRNLLSVGGPEDLLYVAEKGRVQELKADGSYEREISGGGGTAIAVDSSCSLHSPVLTESTTPTCKEFDPFYGDVYLAFYLNSSIHRFDTTGGQTELATTYEGIEGIAVDPAGRLAVVGRVRQGPSGGHVLVSGGSFYDVGVSGLRLLTGFPDSFELNGISFNGNGELYGASDSRSSYRGTEIVAYVPKPVGELVVDPATCEEGSVQESDVTFDCVLHGEVDPWGVSGTEVFFQWGQAGVLDQSTTLQPVANTKNEGEKETPVQVSARIEGLVPNEPASYQLAAYDRWIGPPELLTSERLSFRTPVIAPRILDQSSVSHIRFAAAVMFGELNPENTNASYTFQYVPAAVCKSLAEPCPGMLESPVQESSVYGKIATTVEVTGLQPVTSYRYRLYATNTNGAALNETGGQTLPEGIFETALAPVPRAVTGDASAITATSATISGSANPDGEPATYAFELGVYNGAGTRYGIVLSGPAGASTTPVLQTLGLTGLQPGTTYAYRITIKSGFGESTGQTQTFTTLGLPEVLNVQTPLPQLALPPIVFPDLSHVTHRTLTSAQKLANALRACHKHPKRQRAKCERAAHKKYRVKTRSKK